MIQIFSSDRNCLCNRSTHKRKSQRSIKSIWRGEISMRRIRVSKKRGKSFPNSGKDLFYEKQNTIQKITEYFERYKLSIDIFIVWKIGFWRNQSFGSLLQRGCCHHWLVDSKSTNGNLVSLKREGKFWDETEHASFHGQPGCDVGFEIDSCHNLYWTHCDSILCAKWILWCTSSHGIAFVSRRNNCSVGL